MRDWNRYLRKIKWNQQLRRRLGAVVSGGDFGVERLVRVLLGLLVVGGRRLHHLNFLKGDVLLSGFAVCVTCPPTAVSARF